jgi:hypothetical protein
MKIDINFLEDADDSYKKYTEKGIQLAIVPHRGECLFINGFYHRIIDIVYSDALTGGTEQSICLHLGKSAQSPEEARSSVYEINC